MTPDLPSPPLAELPPLPPLPALDTATPIPVLLVVAPPLVPPKSWLRRNILWLTLAVALVASAGFLRSCYYAGQVKEVLDSHPKPISAKKVATLEKKVRELTQAKAQSQQQADSTYAQALLPEHDAKLRKHLIDSLTTAYHALATDTALATPAAVAAYLQHYTPSPDAEL